MFLRSILGRRRDPEQRSTARRERQRQLHCPAFEQLEPRRMLAGFSFADFSDASGLNLVGNASITAENHLRVSYQGIGAAWFAAEKQFVADGFSTQFQIQMGVDHGTSASGGMAFVLQNSDSMAIDTLSNDISRLGYHGIANSLAIEFDIYESSNGDVDLGPSHISIHTNGTDPNSSNESYSIGGFDTRPTLLDDEQVHTIKLDYAVGVLSVYLDDLSVPVLSVDVNLAEILSLDEGSAWVGFTAASQSTGAGHDVVNWEFLTGDETSSSFARVSPVSESEGNSATTEYVFSVTRTGDVTGTAKLDWTTLDDTATVADGDYIAATGQIVFAPGETEQFITILVNGDRRIEADETFHVRLRPTSDGGIFGATGKGTILNDDFGFSISDAATFKEGDTTFVPETFVAAGTGGLENPWQIAIGPDGDLFVADNAAADPAVRRYDGTTGEYIGSLAPSALGAGPVDLVFGPDGNLYVLNTYQPTEKVYRYDGVTGEFIDVFIGPPDVGNGEDFEYVSYGLAFGPDGNLYLTDFHFSWIHRYQGPFGSSPGAFIDTFADLPENSVPVDVVFGPDGDLYVSCLTIADGEGIILRIDGQTGEPIETLDDTGGWGDPAQLAFDADGNLCVADFGLGAVLRFQGPGGANPGQLIDHLVPAGAGGLTEPFGLAIDAAGNILVADSATADVLRYTRKPGAAIVTVTLSQPLDVTTTVNYVTVEGSAKEGLDFVRTEGTLTFAPGELTKQIYVPIIDDQIPELPETFSVRLFDPTAGASFVNDQATVTIFDDDKADFGDAPDNYGTLLASDGAVHIPIGPMLGTHRDAETDGAPTTTARGDDNAGAPDDEDGVEFIDALRIDETATIRVTASAAGKLNYFIDFNRNGVFGDNADEVFSADVVAGVNILRVAIPQGASAGATYARFRLSTAGGLGPTGLALDGEVEDYQVTILAAHLDHGDAPNSYGTTLASNGARHARTGPMLGAFRDGEPNGVPTSTALGDDATGTPDDEDGVVFVGPLNAGATVRVQVTASAAGVLDFFLDFDRNGVFGNNANEVFTRNVVAGLNTISVAIPLAAQVGDTYARFRISTAGGLTATGLADDGEVEDYQVTILPAQLDFGDAPDSYGTTIASNGARHVLTGPLLGTKRDAESDGQPTSGANGDDIQGGADDEDGVAFTNLLPAGSTVTVRVTASAAGRLDYFFDFNRNGLFGDNPNEVFAANLVAGVNHVSVAVPHDALVGNTYARFRISTAGGLGPTGLAADGEVEDFRVEILVAGTPLVIDANLPQGNGAGNSQADEFRLVRQGANLELYINGRLSRSELFAGVGAIFVNGSTDKDTLIVDNGGGLIHRPIAFDGGKGTDTLRITGNPSDGLADGTYRTGAAGTNGFSGTISYLSAAGTQTITFTGLEPIEDLMVARAFTVIDTAGANVIHVKPGSTSGQPDPLTGVKAKTHEINFTGLAATYRFRNKQSLTIDAGNGNDALWYTAPSGNFGGGPTQLTFKGGNGTDSFRYTGSSADEQVTLKKGSASVVMAGRAVMASSVESILAEAGTGLDKVTFRDSAGNDRFSGGPTSSEMQGPGYRNTAQGFDQVLAIATAGGTDDRAALDGTAGNDVFNASPTAATLVGAGLFLDVRGFDRVTAKANGGAKDQAFFTDSSGNDTFDGGPTLSYLKGAGFYNIAEGFDEAVATATNGGNDIARFRDSAGNDTFTARPEYAEMLGAGASFLARAQGFDRYEAFATAGGTNDQAYLFDRRTSTYFKDTRPRDVYTGRNNYGRYQGIDFHYYVEGFDRVRATASAPTPDVLDILALNYVLEAIGFEKKLPSFA
jgi:hypothetical protein